MERRTGQVRLVRRGVRVRLHRHRHLHHLRGGAELIGPDGHLDVADRHHRPARRGIRPRHARLADPGDRLRTISGCRGWPTRSWAGSSAGSRSPSWPSWWSRWTTRSPRRSCPVLLNYEGTATIAWLVTALVLLLQALLVAFSTPWAERVNNGVRLTRTHRHGDADGAAADRGRRARRHGRLAICSARAPSAAEGFWSFGDWTSAGPWMLGFLLGAFTIVGFESAANLAEETNDPERVVPRAMWQAVLASGVLGFVFLDRRDACRRRPRRAGRVRAPRSPTSSTTPSVRRSPRCCC